MLMIDESAVDCFDSGGRLVVDASTADAPDMITAAGNDVVIEDLRTSPIGAPAVWHATERLIRA
jgi:hypothetical protein